MDRLLTAEHIATLGLIAIAIATLLVAARVRPGRWTVVAARTLALVILINECGWWVWLAGQHTWSVSYALPLQLCDVVAFVAAAALWFHLPMLVELTYFWGIAGTANGLVSPDVPDHFPSYLFLQYFIAHGAIVAAALFLVIGQRISPRPGAVTRVIGLTLVLVVVDAAANLLTDGNYMYLRHTPAIPSLLNLMGPWPWYILAAAALAVAIFVALDAPFGVSRRRSEGRPAGVRATGAPP